MLQGERLAGPLDSFGDKGDRNRFQDELYAAGLEISGRLGWPDPSIEKVEPIR
jgi:hypothetical protein